MQKNYDWIVVGAGFTGASVAYELIKKGFAVLLLEQNPKPDNATRYSYGGLAFWSGSTALTRQLCDQGRQRYGILSSELNADIEFRELDLLLTIDRESDPDVVCQSYGHVAQPPRLLSIKEACLLEPLLNPDVISGALTVRHGHIEPEKTAQAFIQAFLRLGGELVISQVLQLNSFQKSITVTTTTGIYKSAKIAVCTGGISRKLLQESGISMQTYFTHAEILETAPTEIKLSTLVMPAKLQRFQLEANSTQNDEFWCNDGNEIETSILDTGAVQFLDGRFRLGQISRILVNPNATVDAKISEHWLRSHLSQILPGLASLPAIYHHCLVAFSKDNLPIIGSIAEHENIYIFSGFSNPLVFIPPLAQRFANSISGHDDEIIHQLSPNRLKKNVEI
ncbi:NAD(P)/FAD-dependent oxidoreductase [Brunnivagina elsteri]|uniref:FAD-dependent oxidoreductase n=1 Tax=Brunnivagina elsteri CCALA 953 TaxID=987040 RepID=A0A2A2TJN7_9CYAN|nr:FAD-binding oxidoreductase [Calothrix elsteri]PAX53978.1 FAD-dependent oxidoreductase [Calothrix elsteri CCALA 953]